MEGIAAAYGSRAYQRSLASLQGIGLALRRAGCCHSPPMVSGMSARGWTLFAIVAVLWGIPYLFIKVAVD
ncbi:hypothetical protein, partial [Pseudomonas aeruginosa]|uniref:hypothetical protein n=1 Tax=Pseudomonas aeruginosa TaxID=287 RepID=UPI002888AE27